MYEKKVKKETLPSTFVNQKILLKGTVYLRSYYELNEDKWIPTDRSDLMNKAFELCKIDPNDFDCIPSWAWQAIERKMNGEALILFIDVLTQNTLKIASLFSAICVKSDSVYRYADRSLEQDHKASVNRQLKHAIHKSEVPIFLRLGELNWDILEQNNGNILLLNYTIPFLELKVEGKKTISWSLKRLGQTENKN